MTGKGFALGLGIRMLISLFQEVIRSFRGHKIKLTNLQTETKEYGLFGGTLLALYNGFIFVSRNAESYTQSNEKRVAQSINPNSKLSLCRGWKSRGTNELLIWMQWYFNNSNNPINPNDLNIRRLKGKGER